MHLLSFGIRATGYYSFANTKDICFLIGPEGDFSLKEIQMLKKKKQIKAVSLGPQRLHTETAGVFVATWGYEKCFSLIFITYRKWPEMHSDHFLYSNFI